MRYLTRPAAARSAFTLIELIVVMVLMVVLATLAMLVSPRLADDQRSSRGADLLQGWLLIAKQKAYRDQVPRGLRLIPDAANPNVVRELVYIERPEDLRFDVGDPTNYNGTGNALGVMVPAPWLPNSNANPNFHQVLLQNVNLVAGDQVMAGDFLQMNTYETPPYNVHRINQVTFPFVTVAPNPTGGPPPFVQITGTLLTLAAVDGTTSPIGPLGNGFRIRPQDRTSLQIVRKPRPMAGEPVLQLPREIVIDFDIDPNTGASRSYMPGAASGDADIIFNPRGQIMGTNGNDGKIILRVRNGDKPQDFGPQTLITIFTRTGLIAAFPVNNDPTGLNDPFKFTRQGKYSGM